MVYAIALGVADKALENMSLVVPPEQLKHSHFYGRHRHGVFVLGFQSAHNKSTANAQKAESKGPSGVGGGFGGGGGGAR